MTAPPRRTQDQRRAETRRRLLDATIECVAELGYSGATTRRIAERAEVSVGAVTHHFQYRVDLVAAAVEELVRRRLVALRQALDALPDDRAQRVRATLDLLWGDFSGPLFTVMVKLWIAAGDEEELYERMVPLERLLARAAANLQGDLGLDVDTAEGGKGMRVNPRYAVVVSTLRGLALSRAFEPRAGQVRDPWPAYRAELERYLLS
ncbi:MAG: TetR/AcrR family transcriptional regulator [Solirubrobacteraceae bacterium]|nr:TetR/AcrR family transcriptional regulator [Patulibacter sp.]